MLFADKTSNVVILPTHKSYMDSILVNYIHYHFKLEYPFMCGCESFFSLAMISVFMKYTNGFYLNKNHMKNDLYKSVVDSYVWALLKHNCLLEVFMENTRSRTGKINSPSDELFGRVVKLYLDSPEKKDLKLVPLTINYDRVHDGESFPLELLGESPQRNNIHKILQHLIAINKPLGRVMIKYCGPLSIKDYIDSHAKKNGIAVSTYGKDEAATKKLIDDLGQEISLIQGENLVVMSTPLVATILLMHKKGISQDMLISRVNWLYHEIKARKGELSLTSAPSSTIIT